MQRQEPGSCRRRKRKRTVRNQEGNKSEANQKGNKSDTEIQEKKENVSEEEKPVKILFRNAYGLNGIKADGWHCIKSFDIIGLV